MQKYLHFHRLVFNLMDCVYRMGWWNKSEKKNQMLVIRPRYKCHSDKLTLWVDFKAKVEVKSDVNKWGEKSKPQEGFSRISLPFGHFSKSFLKTFALVHDELHLKFLVAQLMNWSLHWAKTTARKSIHTTTFFTLPWQISMHFIGFHAISQYVIKQSRTVR